MRPTDILRQEHRIIERVLDALETAADRLERGDPMRPGFFLDAADFARGFADGCHHRKEEDVLFPAMTASGLPLEGGPIAVMLEDHSQGRALVRAIRDSAGQLAGGDAPARLRLVAAVRSYVALLREHIDKEDQVLFPMAEELVPPDRRAGMIGEFDRLEQAEAGEHEKYAALADALGLEASA